MRARWFLVGLLAAIAAAQTTPTEFRIAGTVVHGQTSQPMGNVRLSVIRAQTPDTLQTLTTGDAGHFVFSGVAPGKYVLVAKAVGFPQQSLDEHAGFSTAVVVGPGKDSENIVFRLRPEASISGQVVDDTNDPVRDVSVMLFHRASEEGNNAIHLREQTSTNDQGRYHFTHMFPGTYFVVVSGRPWYAQPSQNGSSTDRDVVYPVTYYSGTTDPNSATAITVKPGDKIVADFALAAVPGLRLQLTGPGISDANSVFSATQKIFGEVSVPASNQFDRGSDGKVFLTGLPPGNVEVTGFTPGPLRAKQSWQGSIDLSRNSSLKVGSFHAESSVAGKVILGDTEFRRASIMLVERTTREQTSAMIQKDGSFSFPDAIRPGVYRVTVFSLRGVALSSVTATGARVEGRSVEIAEGSTVSLTVVLSRGVGRIDGTAIQDGKPLAGAMIVLVPQDLANNLPRIRRDQSDSDGTFTLPQIAPGQYTVLAFKEGWDLEWQNPFVLQPYLRGGQSLLVGPNQRYETRINVQ